MPPIKVLRYLLKSTYSIQPAELNRTGPSKIWSLTGKPRMILIDMLRVMFIGNKQEDHRILFYHT